MLISLGQGAYGYNARAVVGELMNKGHVRNNLTHFRDHVTQAHDAGLRFVLVSVGRSFRRMSSEHPDHFN